jgi:poly-gamma-glutamate synthesis protein (capsule biosynthesis protein)
MTIAASASAEAQAGRSPVEQDVRVRRPSVEVSSVEVSSVEVSSVERIARSVAGPVRPAAPPRRVRPHPLRVRIAASGDVLPHTPVVHAAARAAGGRGHDFRGMFARLEPLVGSADVGICHLETPVAPPGEPLSSYPAYGVPAAIAAGVAAAGYDRCSTASNHTLDRGVAGVDATVDALEAAGLDQSGMARDPAESVPRVIVTNGVRFAHLSYTYSFNGARLPADQPWRSALIDPDRIVRDAQAVRARGADAVIVSLHWGDEGRSTPSVFQRTVADRVTASGAVDLIIGHHAHVLQPIERINGVWVIFGLGNQLSNMPTGSYPPSSQDGAVVTVDVVQRAGGAISVSRPVVHPTWVDRQGGFVIRPVLSDLVDPSVSASTKAAMRVSLARTRAVVGAFVPAG